MCGIAGIVMQTEPASWERMSGALQQLHHRGPDGEGMAGITFHGTIATPNGADTRLLFGFRRLAILDLTAHADQPMRCPHSGNLLIFNGEIYNFIELRAELESHGYRFTTQSDSEVILASYLQWGEDAFPRFNGMWGLALYDATTGDVLLSRDRMGVKPLYYASDGERFLFASELRAVIHLLGFLPPVNDKAAFDFLSSIEIDHEDATLYAGICTLPAGALWRIAPNGHILRREYHRWPETIHEQINLSTLRDLVSDAVRLRLRADAPTVSLLSGGLDSSLITWLAATHNRPGTRSHFTGAFSYGYDQDAYAAHDEIARAQALIQALPIAIDHHTVRMNPVPTLDEMLAMTAAQELPINTPSAIAGWRLYQHIRAAKIKVVLSGEGADELFAGYTRRYLPLLASEHLRRGEWGAAWRIMRSPQLENQTLLKRLAWHLPRFMLQHLLPRMRPNNATLAQDFRDHHPLRFQTMVEHQRQPLSALWRADVIHSSMPHILRYADRNSMASSVELRLPFMDYRLVEMALRAGPHAQLSPQGGKQMLRQAFADILPAQILNQPKTHGFGNAEQYQLQHCDLMPLLDRAPATAWHYINRNALARQLRRPHVHPMLWLPISFLLWLTVREEQLGR